MNNKILATVAFGFVVILTSVGCSGTAPEGSDIQSSELKAPKGKGGDTGKDKDVPPDTSKETPPADGKGEPTPPPPSEKGEPSKEPPSEASCFVVVEKSACQSDDAWKNAAAKICDAKGLSLTGLSTSDDCKGGSTVAKIECCK